jgi:hypothetical protein
VNLGQGSAQLTEDLFGPGRLTESHRSEIQAIQNSKASMMPVDLLDKLKEEVLVLLAYLLPRRPAA